MEPPSKLAGLSAAFGSFARLPRSVYILFLARMVNAVGMFVYPFMTLLLTQKMGLAENTAGFIVTLTVLASGVGLILGGHWTDRFGRRKLILIAQGLAATSLVPCAFIEQSPLLPVLLALSTFFNTMAQPAHNAMATDLSDSSNRKATFSLLYLGNNIGFAVGPLIAGFLFNHSLEWLFIGDAASTYLSLFLLWRFVPETIPSFRQIEENQTVTSIHERPERGNTLMVLWRRPMLLLFGLTTILYAFVYAQSTFALPLYTNALFGESGPTVYGSLMSVNAIVILLGTLLLTTITLRSAPVLAIALAGLLFAGGFGLLFFSASYPLLVLSTVVWSLGEILTNTNSFVYIADHTPISHRGRFTALLSFFPGIGLFLGPATMGVFIAGQGVKMAWPLIFLLGISGAVAMAILYFWEKRNKGKQAADSSPVS